MRAIYAFATFFAAVVATNTTTTCGATTIYLPLPGPTVTVTVASSVQISIAAPGSSSLSIDVGAITPTPSATPVIPSFVASASSINYPSAYSSFKWKNSSSAGNFALPATDNSKISTTAIPSSGWNVSSSSSIAGGFIASPSQSPAASETLITLYFPESEPTSTIFLTVTRKSVAVPSHPFLPANQTSSKASWLNDATAISRERTPAQTPCTEELAGAASSNNASFTSPNSSPSASEAPASATQQSLTVSSLTQNIITTKSVQASTATPTVSSLPVPATCGESGNFTLNWDDEPTFQPDSDRADPWAPVFNPYHHLFFSNGYAYIPPGADNEPFAAISSPHLAIFLPNLTDTDIGSPNAAGVNGGEISAGPRAAIDAFWFDAYSVYVGCDNPGPDDCIFTTTGWIWDANSQEEVRSVTQSAALQPCGDSILNCTLTQLTYDAAFHGLSGIQFDAKVGGEETIFLLDNLAMAWTNNTCAAGLLRQRSRK